MMVIEDLEKELKDFFNLDSKYFIESKIQLIPFNL